MVGFDPQFYLLIMLIYFLLYGLSSVWLDPESKPVPPLTQIKGLFVYRPKNKENSTQILHQLFNKLCRSKILSSTFDMRNTRASNNNSTTGHGHKICLTVARIISNCLWLSLTFPQSCYSTSWARAGETAFLGRIQAEFWHQDFPLVKKTKKKSDTISG